jgi:hypothetical protein
MRVFSPVNVFISEHQASVRCINPGISELPLDNATSAYRFSGFYFWYQ